MDDQTNAQDNATVHGKATDPWVILPLGTCGAPTLPQEMQDMVIEGNADDIRTLLRTSLVNRAWRMKTVEYLFTRIVVRAVARCSIGYAIEELDDVPEIRDQEIPGCTFTEAMDTVPHYVDAHVRTLVLRAAHLRTRMENATRGVRLAKPELCAHDIQEFLTRFPRIHSIVIEDVNWVPCPDQQWEDCECMETMEKRAYETLAFRRITHNSSGFENVMVLTQSAASIENLILESVDLEETVTLPYTVVQVPAFTLGIASNQWRHGPPIPEFEPHTLKTLNVTNMSTLDISLIRDIIKDHNKTLREASFRAWLFDGGTYLLQVSTLTHLLHRL